MYLLSVILLSSRHQVYFLFRTIVLMNIDAAWLAGCFQHFLFLFQIIRICIFCFSFPFEFFFIISIILIIWFIFLRYNLTTADCGHSHKYWVEKLEMQSYFLLCCRAKDHYFSQHVISWPILYC